MMDRPVESIEDFLAGKVKWSCQYRSALAQDPYQLETAYHMKML